MARGLKFGISFLALIFASSPANADPITIVSAAIYAIDISAAAVVSFGWATFAVIKLAPFHFTVIAPSAFRRILNHWRTLILWPAHLPSL